MFANLANHMSDEILTLLPMWSKVVVEKAEDEPMPPMPGGGVQMR